MVQFREISSRVKTPNFGFGPIGLSKSNWDSFIVLKIILRPSRYPNVVGSVIGA